MMRRPWVCIGRMLIFFLLPFVLGSGCASIKYSKPEMGGVIGLPEPSAKTVIPTAEISDPTIDYDAAPPSLSLKVTGQVKTKWEERKIYEKVVTKTTRSHDKVEFPILTGMHACEAVGFYSMWNAMYEEHDGAFGVTDKMGMPLTRALLKEDKHIFGELWEADGRLESDIFPLTLSGEWFASIPGLAGYSILPITLIGTMFEDDDCTEWTWYCIKDPFVLVLSPVCDLGIYAIDLPITFFAVPMDFLKDGVVLTADTVCMTGALAVDVAKLPVTLLYDSVVALGDAVWPGDVKDEPETQGELPGKWTAREKILPLDYTSLSIRVSVVGEKWKKEISPDKDGSARISIRELDSVLSRTNESCKILVEVLNGKEILAEKNVDLDRKQLAGRIIKRPGDDER